MFRKNDGQIGAVVKAILLDPEARQGDDVIRSQPRFGRIRDRHLLNVGLMRALGCRLAIRSLEDPGRPLYVGAYSPLSAESVFNFYPPDHRASVSGLLAPELRHLDGAEFDSSLGRPVIDLMEARLFRGRLSPVLLQLAMVSPALGAAR